MIQNFEHMGHRIEVYFTEKECNWFVYHEGQFLEKGQGYKGNRFHENGCMKDARATVEKLVAHGVIKRRLGRFGQAFQYLK